MKFYLEHYQFIIKLLQNVLHHVVKMNKRINMSGVLKVIQMIMYVEKQI